MDDFFLLSAFTEIHLDVKVEFSHMAAVLEPLSDDIPNLSYSSSMEALPVFESSNRQSSLSVTKYFEDVLTLW